MRYFFLLIISTVVIFISAGLYYSGAFKPVPVKIEDRGPFAILYLEHIGAYDKIVNTIEDVEHLAKKNHAPCPLTFGEYLDNPQDVEQARLRSRGGCLTYLPARAQANPYYSISHMIPQEPLPYPVKSEIISQKNYVIATFDGSPRIGPLKVYPKANDFAKDHNLNFRGAVIEIYDVHPDLKTMTITYLFPIAPTPDKP